MPSVIQGQVGETMPNSNNTSEERSSLPSEDNRSFSLLLDDDKSPTQSKDSKRSKFHMPGRLRQSGSPEPEDVPEIQTFSKSTNATKSWKVKISNHVAPPEHEERYVRTRERVRDVVQKILGYGSNAAHDVLEIGASALQLSAFGGLAPAAQTLVIIWNALELVESNQLACLSLTERCVDTLIVIREEITEAGENIENQLAFPLKQLNESFDAVRTVLQAQVHRPFYKRYLKRSEIQDQIEACDAKLSNSLELFSLKIQIRSLQRLESAEARRGVAELRSRQHVEKLLEALPDKLKKQDALSISGMMTVAETVPTEINEESSSSDPTNFKDFVAATMPRDRAANPSTASEVRRRMNDLVLKQNNRDFTLDLAEQRHLMREVLEASSDDELLDTLQVKRVNPQEVLKELQGALSKDASSGCGKSRHLNFNASSTLSGEPTVGISRASTMPTKLYEQDISDELDKAFIECSIKALKRTKTM